MSLGWGLGGWWLVGVGWVGGWVGGRVGGWVGGMMSVLITSDAAKTQACAASVLWFRV